MTETTIVPLSQTAIQVAPGSPAEASQFIRMALERGQSAGDLKTLFEVYERMVLSGQKTAFDKAMTQFQSECPPMPRGHASHLTRVNTAGVQVKSRYSDMADIASTIAPSLRANGLSYEWEDTELLEVGGQPYYRAHIRIRHESGYSERKSGPPIPIGKGNNNQSVQMQATAVVTTAQRLALRSAFGLYSIDQDEEDAAEQAGTTDTITDEQGGEIVGLLETVSELQGEGIAHALRLRMLDSLGVNRIADIPAAKFEYVRGKLAASVKATK